jgi:hypothetical protein
MLFIEESDESAILTNQPHDWKAGQRSHGNLRPEREAELTDG